MKTLIQAAVVTLFAASTAQAQQAVQWRVQDGGNGHWYAFKAKSTVICWHDARALCELQGGHLASITSSAENQLLLALTIPNNPGGIEGGPYIGGTCEGLPWGQWYWITGEPFSYTAWMPGAPNGSGGATEPYLHFWRWSNLGWNDQVDCGGLMFSYLIEWDADCNGDGIVDYGQCRDGSLSDFDGDNSPDCCESGAPCVASNYPVQWRTSDGGNGHWYQLVAAPGIGWSSASGYADALGATLASLTTPAENSFVVMAFAGRAARYPWIGLRQAPDAAEPAGGWAWVSGEPLSWTNWSPSEPNGDGSFDADQANIWLVDEPDRPLGTWNDWHSGGPDGYVLEWSADCNGDGIVDYGQILQGQLADTNQDGIPDVCQVPTCVDADLFRNGIVNGADLGILLSQWGPAIPNTVSDIDNDGAVDGADLGLLLSFWGGCP